MNIARRNHGFIYLNNTLYAIGGQIEFNNSIVQCERFDQNDEFGGWVKIADLLQPVANPGICTFKNKYIFVFGGQEARSPGNNFIQYYDNKFDLWQEILLYYDPIFSQKTFSFNCSSGAQQISENSMIVFGGYSKKYQNLQQQSYLITLSREDNTRMQFNISYFKSQQAIVENKFDNNCLLHENKLYCVATQVQQKVLDQ